MAAFSNSYIESETELETLIGDNPKTAAIALKAATASVQAWYCQEASRNIDALPLRGERYENKYIENAVQVDENEDGLIQVLEFPRYINGVVCDWDYVTELPIIPSIVKQACVEEAIALYEHYSSTDRQERAAMQEQGVKAYSLGGGYSETFGPSITSRYGLVGKRTYDLMARYIMRSVPIV